MMLNVIFILGSKNTTTMADHSNKGGKLWKYTFVYLFAVLPKNPFLKSIFTPHRMYHNNLLQVSSLVNKQTFFTWNTRANTFWHALMCIYTLHVCEAQQTVHSGRGKWSQKEEKGEEITCAFSHC